MDEKDLVSIIMPCHNGGKYIESAIRSVLSQTNNHFELIIVDDGSIDSSREIIKSFEDKRITLLCSKRSQGASISRNLAIEHAKGRYIAFLDCDDEWLPNKLELQISLMKQNKLAFSWSAYYVVNADGSILRTQNVKTHGSYSCFLSKAIMVGCLTAVYDSHLLGKMTMPIIKMRQDLGLWLSIVKKCQELGFGFSGISAPLARYRVHNMGLSSNKRKAALYQWKLYRDVEGLSFLKSTFFFLSYVVNGLRDRLVK